MDTFDPEVMAGRNQGISDSTTPTSGYRASYRIQVQEGGRIAGSAINGNTLVMMGPSSLQHMGQAADAKYLDPRLTPGPAWLEVAMLLRRVKGDVSVNRDQIVAELATKPIAKVAGDHLKSAVTRLRGYCVNAFWGDGTGSLGTAAATTSVDESNTDWLSVSGGTFARFMSGDVLQAGTDASPRVLKTGTGANGSTGLMNVVKVDRINRRILLQARPGVGTVTVSSGDHLMYADTYNFSGGHATDAAKRVPEGVESLIIGSGTYPGTGYDVANFPELVSFVEDVSATPEDPTPESVAKILDTIADGGYAPPEALFAERSLWTYYSQLERESGAQYVVPQGAQFRASGGVEGPVVAHMGTTFQRFSSVRMRPQTLVGLAPSEWMKFIPLGNKTIHWIIGSGPMAGIQSIFYPVTDGPQLTELSSAPFESYIQFGCKVPGRQFRKTGYKTQRSVS